jgi:DNA gyrase/topoisomerase IV subunit B
MRDENALRDIKTIWYRTLFDIDISVDGGRTSKNLNTSHLYMETTLPDGTKVHRLNKNHDEFRNLCMVVDHIGEVVTHQADLLNVDFGLIEQLLHCVDALDEKHVDTEKIKNTMLECDDVIWDKENNVLIIVDSQGIENRVPLAGLQHVLKGIILPLYQRANWDKFNLFVSTKYTDKFVGQPCTFMMLYQIFKDLDGLCEITRFKGLGEMGPEDIAMTCINKSTRCFTTIRGIGDLDTIYKMLDADTEARKKLIDNNYLD